MTFGSWAPLIIFLEHIGVLGRVFAIHYNGKQRFQKYFQNNVVFNFLQIEGWPFFTYGSWAPLIIFLKHIGDLGRVLGIDFSD